MRERSPGIREIERAVAAVQKAGWVSGPGKPPVVPDRSQGDRAALRSASSSGIACPWPCTGNGAVSRVDVSIVVPIRGHVPLAFFAWFKDVRERADLECRMLELCSFECPDGYADTAGTAWR